MSVIDGMYRLEVVGGPFDGVRGFSWRVYRDFPLPKLIRVGTCSGRRECNARDCVGRRHASFWVPEFEDPLVATVPYVLQDDSVDEPADGRSEGKACYALGGLGIGRRAVARETAPVGAEGGVCYG